MPAALSAPVGGGLGAPVGGGLGDLFDLGSSMGMATGAYVAPKSVSPVSFPTLPFMQVNRNIVKAY